MFNFIYYYSYITFYLQKLFNYLFNPVPKELATSLYLIKNNFSKEICKNELAILSPVVFDFILYNDTVNNHILYFTIPEVFEYKCCAYKFISLSMMLPDFNKTFFIDLKGYHIADNKLNKLVFYYLLKTQHNILYSGPYQLTIIDHNVKIINIDETNEIILDINDYYLKKN